MYKWWVGSWMKLSSEPMECERVSSAKVVGRLLCRAGIMLMRPGFGQVCSLFFASQVVVVLLHDKARYNSSVSIPHLS